MEEFQYRHLDDPASEVRLVELCWSPEGNSCWKISHAELNQANFQALSYVWGEEEKTYSYRVVDDDYQVLGWISVTANLVNAISDLWHSSEISPKIFWIDQICINQHDGEEKAQQVQIMGQIYTEATRVITWLGSGTIHDEAAIAYIDQVYEHFEPNIEFFAWNGLLDPFALRDSLPVSKPLVIACPEDAEPALNDMVFGGWTERLWMVQENYLNLETVFLRGPFVIPWIRISFMATLMHARLIPPTVSWGNALRAFNASYLSLERRIVAAITSVKNLHEHDFAARSLSLNLVIHAKLRCQDPRDRIYSLLAMSSDASQLGIIPDYTKSVAEVFIDASVRVLQAGQHRHFYYTSATDNLGDLNVPSWCITPSPTQVSGFGSAPYGTAHPTPTNYLYCDFEDELRTLVCKGRICSSVEFASVRISHYSDWTPDGPSPFLLELYGCAQVIGLEAITQESISSFLAVAAPERVTAIDDARYLAYFITDLYQRAMSESRPLNNSLQMEGLSAHVQQLQDWQGPPLTGADSTYQLFLKTRMREGDKEPQALNVPPVEATDSRYFHFVQGYLRRRIGGRKLGFDSEGRMFNANSKTEVGDVIAVLQGFDQPWVLRKVAGTEKYQFVGDIWVKGIMNCELYDGLNPEDVDYEIRLV